MDFFQKSTIWLAGTLGVRGIDWVKLAAAGKPGVHNVDYIEQYMVPAFAAAAQTMSTLDLKPGTTTEVLLDYYDLRKKLSDDADSVLQVVGTTIQVANPLLTVTTIWSALNNLLFYAWSVSAMGFQSHATGAIQRSGVSDADIARHADIVTMMCNLLARLDKAGFLAAFKKNNSTSGLGVAPAVIALGVVVIVAVAWMVVAIYEASRINARIDAACARALQTGDPKDQATCQQMQASSNALSSQIPDAVSGVIEKVSIAAMVGAGIYVLVQFGPGIATKLKQTLASWKAG